MIGKGKQEHDFNSKTRRRKHPFDVQDDQCTVNFKFLHCIYPIEVMNEIQTILEKGRVKKMKIRIKKKDIKE